MIGSTRPGWAPRRRISRMQAGFAIAQAQPKQPGEMQAEGDERRAGELG